MAMPESKQLALLGSDGKSLPRFSVPLLLKRQFLFDTSIEEVYMTDHLNDR
jgi:hypothetical protein